MTDGKFTLYIRKLILNPLMARKQMSVEILHPEVGGVSKKEIKAKIAEMMKSSPENIAVFGSKTKFGGGRSSCFVCVYTNKDARAKFDHMVNKRRDGIVDKAGRTPRKMAKEIKGKRKRVKGTAKAKVTTGKKKK